MSFPMFTDDPVRDAEAYYNALEEKLAKQPVCCRCKEHIQQEFAVQHNGKWYCEECEDDAWEEIREEHLCRTSNN